MFAKENLRLVILLAALAYVCMPASPVLAGHNTPPTIIDFHAVYFNGKIYVSGKVTDPDPEPVIIVELGGAVQDTFSVEPDGVFSGIYTAPFPFGEVSAQATDYYGNQSEIVWAQYTY